MFYVLIIEGDGSLAKCCGFLRIVHSWRKEWPGSGEGIIRCGRVGLSDSPVDVSPSLCHCCPLSFAIIYSARRIYLRVDKFQQELWLSILKAKSMIPSIQCRRSIVSQ